MRVHYFQHAPFEGLASIAEWLSDFGHTVSSTQWWMDGTAPARDSFDWLIVMGGPMGVNDEAEYPWLVEEKRCIDRAIRDGRRVLGVCLGAQLVAAALGARVYPNDKKEIGWHPVRRTAEALVSPFGRIMPEEAMVFHWHGDTFDLPAGAVHVAESKACRNQAFAYGDKVLALQFHLETTPAFAHALVRHCASELVAAPYIQTATEILTDEGRFAAINGLMRRFLDQMAVDQVG